MNVFVVRPVSYGILLPFLESGFHSERGLSLVKFSIFHVLKKLEGLRGRTIPPWRGRRIEPSDVFHFLGFDFKGGLTNTILFVVFADLLEKS